MGTSRKLRRQVAAEHDRRPSAVPAALAGAIAAAALCVSGLTAYHAWRVGVFDREIRAPRLAVASPDGRTAAALGTDRGLPALTLLGPEGRPAARIGCDNAGAGFLSLFDRAGRERVVLSMKDGDMPRAYLRDRRGEPAAVLGLGQADDPFLSMLDNAGRIRATYGATVVRDAEGNAERVPFGLVAFSEDGKVVAAVPALR